MSDSLDLSSLPLDLQSQLFAFMGGMGNRTKKSSSGPNDALAPTLPSAEEHRKAEQDDDVVEDSETVPKPHYIPKTRPDGKQSKNPYESLHLTHLHQKNDSNVPPESLRRLHSSPLMQLEWSIFHSIIHQLFSNGIAIVDNFFSQKNANEHLLRNFLRFDLRKLHLRHGKVSSESKVDVERRGDVHTFINDQILENLANDGAFHASNLNRIIERMRCVPLLMNELYGTDFDHDSIQVAVYEGEGKRYVKHADATPFNATERRLTMLLYLNDPDEVKGGNLRFYRNERSLHTEPLYQHAKGSSEIIDVEPLFNRLVVFPSDYYHEVLPAHFTRRAITLWCYSKKDLHTVLRPQLSAVLPRLASELEDGKIFVSICSYRDSECGPTVEDLFYKATYSDRLRVGINWQYSETDDVELFNSCSYYGKNYSSQIREIRMSYKAAKGPVFARALVQKHLYNDEEFYLQIDSHMRFEKGWDVTLVRMLQQVEHTSGRFGKCVLSTYPVGYELPNDLPDNAQITLLCATKFAEEKNTEDFTFEMLRLTGKSVMVECNHPLVTPFWAAGFSFSRGSMVREVPYDATQEYVFFGEEILMAARLFASGYTIFAPNDIVLYHLWRRDYRNTFRENETTGSKGGDTDDQEAPTEPISSLMPLVSRVKHVALPQSALEEHSTEAILQRKTQNLRRVMDSLGMIPNDSTTSSLQQSGNISDFQEYCGVNFLERRISQEALCGGFDKPQYLL